MHAIVVLGFFSFSVKDSGVRVGKNVKYRVHVRVVGGIQVVLILENFCDASAQLVV